MIISCCAITPLLIADTAGDVVDTTMRIGFISVAELVMIVAAAAIGGTVWTVADIYAAVLRQQELPGVIKRDIDAQLADMGAASRKFIATVEASTNIPTPSKNL